MGGQDEERRRRGGQEQLGSFWGGQRWWWGEDAEDVSGRTKEEDPNLALSNQLVELNRQRSLDGQEGLSLTARSCSSKEKAS